MARANVSTSAAACCGDGRFVCHCSLKVPPSPILGPSPAIDVSDKNDGHTGCRFWVRGDYLLWNVRKAPLPNPLVTAGSPFDPLPGAVGQPGTRALLDESGMKFGPVSGMRLTLGVWCNHERNVCLLP